MTHPLRYVTGATRMLVLAVTAGVLTSATPLWAAVGDVISVTRVYEDGSAQAIEYVVEETGAWSVKFEDADVGLGENLAVQTDIFVLQIPDANGSVTIETKASTETATSVLNEVGDVNTDDLGFHVSLDSVDGDVFTISVTSESPEHALSHVTFFFFEGNYAEPLYD